jgi:PKD repeat protein
MNKLSLKRFGTKMALLTLLALPELADAQLFNYNSTCDILAGFRKTGVFQGGFELVADLGSITNLLNLPIGTTITVTNFSPTQLSNAFIDTGDIANLQWSVFAAFPLSRGSWVTSLGSFPANTLWLTLPASGVTTQSTPPSRVQSLGQANQKVLMNSVGSGATSIANFLAVSNVNNTPFLVREPIVYNFDYLTAFIGSSMDPAIGNFGANNSGLPYSVENTTPDPFISAQRNDFYQLCPSLAVDPINGSTTNAYFVGYFLLNPNGSMTFTRQIGAPLVSFKGGPTSGFQGFTAVFTNNSTGSVTNYIWDFGDGTMITNSTLANVSHVYVTGGNFVVTLTAEGPGGVIVQTEAGSSFITVGSLPTFVLANMVGGQLVLSGTNCPPNAQYRILTSTNLALPTAGWTPLVTNIFNFDTTWSFNYSNSAAQKTGFFQLVSP